MKKGKDWRFGIKGLFPEPAFETVCLGSSRRDGEDEKNGILKCICLALGNVPGLDKRRRYDSHCHVFNWKIIEFYMIIFYLSRILAGFEDNKPDENQPEIDEGFFEGVGKFFDKLIKTLHFLEIGLSSSSVAIAKKMDCRYRGRFNLVPLMFDLDGCFIGAKGGSAEGFELLKPKLKNLPGRIGEKMQHKYLSAEVAKRDTEKKIVTNAQRVVQKLDSISKKNSFFAKENEQTIDSERNFQEQIGMILDCKKALKNKVFPFFVVDPRRKGIFEMFLRHVVEEKSFKGVKIYCPNGYTPTDPMLFGREEGDECVYSICEKLQIPIIAHCSRGGFATYQKAICVSGHIMEKDLQSVVPVNDFVLEFDHDLDHRNSMVYEVCARLNHPRLWELVLERYPNLKLDLAHWGGESSEWRGMITEMLRKYPNLYTDLACTEEKFFLDQVRDLTDPTKEFLREKVLYGSDYHILMLFSDSIDSYLKMFISNLPKSLWDKISITNPKRFLGE